jgi:hypothetical protein
MNSDLMQRQADALVARLGPEGSSEQDRTGRIQRAYRILFQREATQKEIERGLAFLAKANSLFATAAAEPLKAASSDSAQTNQSRRRRTAAAANADQDDAAETSAPAYPAGKMTPWQQYTQALLSSGEFYYVN